MPYPMPWGQYMQSQGMNTYDYLANPANIGAPMGGTSFGRIPPQFPQSYQSAMLPGQAYIPIANFTPPRPANFMLPPVQAFGTAGNEFYQTFGGLAVSALMGATGNGGVAGSLGRYNMVQAEIGSIYAQDVSRAMGLSADSNRDPTVAGIGNIFSKIAMAQRGGAEGLARRAKDRLETRGETADAAAIAQEVTRLEDHVNKTAKTAAKKLTDFAYSPGEYGKLGRKALMAFMQTSAGSMLQELPGFQQMAMAPGIMAAGRAMGASPFGMTGAQGEQMTQEIQKAFGGLTQGLDPRLSRGLRPSDIGELSAQLARRGLVTGNYGSEDEAGRQKGRLAALKKSLEEYAPLIDELGQVFKGDKSSVGKLISNLEEMTQGMTQMMGGGKLRNIVRQVRETSAITGISTENVANMYGLAEREARNRGLSPGTGFKAMDMGLRLAEGVRHNQMVFGGEGYIGRRSPDEVARAVTALAMSGASSQAGAVVGGSLEALQVAGFKQGMSRDQMDALSPEARARAIMKSRGVNTDSAGARKLLRYYAGIASGDDSAFVLAASKDQKGMATLMSQNLGISQAAAMSMQYEPTTRGRTMANDYQGAISSIQAEEAIGIMGSSIQGLVGGDARFSKGLVRAALVGSDYSVEGQQSRIADYLKANGRDQAMAAEYQNVIYRETERDRWRTLGGRSMNGEGMNQMLSELLDPKAKLMRQAREAGVKAIYDVDAAARETGIGQDDVGRRLMNSLMTSDDEGFKGTMNKILSGVSEERRDEARTLIEGMRTDFESMMTGAGQGKKGSVGRFRSQMEERAPQIEAIFAEIFNPEQMKKIREDDEARKIAEMEEQGKLAYVKLAPVTLRIIDGDKTVIRLMAESEGSSPEGTGSAEGAVG